MSYGAELSLQTFRVNLWISFDFFPTFVCVLKCNQLTIHYVCDLFYFLGKIFFAVFFKIWSAQSVIPFIEVFRERTLTEKIFKTKRRSREKEATNFICKSKAAIIMGINENEFEHFKHVPALQNWIKTQPHLPQNIGKHSSSSTRNFWVFRFRIIFRGNLCGQTDSIVRSSSQKSQLNSLRRVHSFANSNDSKWRREVQNWFRSSSVYGLSRSQEGSSGNAKMCFQVARCR